MPQLTLWKNQEISKLRRDMDRLFSRLWDDFSMPVSPRSEYERPFIDLLEKGGQLELRAEIPGVNPDDLEISITDDLLTIKGKTETETHQDEGNVHRVERRSGSFSRVIQLPCRVKLNDVKASYEKGILSIKMPKCEPETIKKIKIKYR
jgi:HSP20 family protein